MMNYFSVHHLVCHVDLDYMKAHNMRFLWSDCNNKVFQQVLLDRLIFDILFLKSSLEPWADIPTAYADDA